MTKILTVGDTHFKNDSDTHRILLRELLQVIDEQDITAIVFLGDTFDSQRTLTIECIVAFNQFLAAIQQAFSGPLYFIVGNHDRRTQPKTNEHFTSRNTSLSMLEGRTQITVIYRPEKITICDNEYLFVPYLIPGTFQSVIEDSAIDLSDVCYIFAHQEFTGAKYGGRSEVEEYHLPHPLVSGHIHEYQVLDKITYIGASIHDTKTHTTLPEDQPQQVYLGLISTKTHKLKLRPIAAFQRYKFVGDITSFLGFDFHNYYPSTTHDLSVTVMYCRDSGRNDINNLDEYTKKKNKLARRGVAVVEIMTNGPNGTNRSNEPNEISLVTGPFVSVDDHFRELGINLRKLARRAKRLTEETLSSTVSENRKKIATETGIGKMKDFAKIYGIVGLAKYKKTDLDQLRRVVLTAYDANPDKFTM